MWIDAQARNATCVCMCMYECTYVHVYVYTYIHTYMRFDAVARNALDSVLTLVMQYNGYSPYLYVHTYFLPQTVYMYICICVCV
jgi:hypothetical protein